MCKRLNFSSKNLLEKLLEFQLDFEAEIDCNWIAALLRAATPSQRRSEFVKSEHNSRISFLNTRRRIIPHTNHSCLLNNSSRYIVEKTHANSTEHAYLRVHIWSFICSSPENEVPRKNYLTRDYELVPPHNQQVHSVFLLIRMFDKLYLPPSLKTSTVLFCLYGIAQKYIKISFISELRSIAGSFLNPFIVLRSRISISLHWPC